MRNSQSPHLETLSTPPRRCVNCGAPEHIIWVHGHGQCAHCKMNVMPCCDGASECTVLPSQAGNSA